MTDDKKLLASENMVSRLSKILNQAERAAEGSPEREAFMEKAMALSAAYSIDLAVARAHTVNKEKVEVPERRSFVVGQPGLSANKNAHFADLMIEICEANDIKVTISGNRRYIHGTGMPSDLDMAMRYYALLSVQMVTEADAALKAGANGEVRRTPKMKREEIPEDERAWGEHDGGRKYAQSDYYDEKDEELREDTNGVMLRQRYSDRNFWNEWVKSYPPPKYRSVPVLDDQGAPVYEEKWVSTEDARPWRVNFYQGFVARTGMRLRQAKKDAMREAGIDVGSSDSRAVALRDKAKEVQDAFEENERHVLATGGTYAGAKVNTYSHGGRASGDAAGQRARLGNEKDLDHG